MSDEMKRARAMGYDPREEDPSLIEDAPWKVQARNIGSQRTLQSYQEEDARDKYFQEEEVGLKHNSTGAKVKLSDDGMVDIFAGETLGIRLDPNTNSINFFGEQVNLFTKRFNLRTMPNGFSWNSYNFNPQLYYEDDKERKQILNGTKEYFHYTHEAEPKLEWHRDPWSVRPMTPSTIRERYSQGTLQMMKDLGLPVTGVDQETKY